MRGGRPDHLRLMGQQTGVDADHHGVGQFGIVLANAERLVAVLVVDRSIEAPGQGDRLAVDHKARRLCDQRRHIDRPWLNPEQAAADIAGDTRDLLGAQAMGIARCRAWICDGQNHLRLLS